MHHAASLFSRHAAWYDKAMDDRKEKIKKLKEYFESRDDVALAFLFGSQAKGRARAVSDWDVGVYFFPRDPGKLELEVDTDYPTLHAMWGDVERIVGGSVDLVALNRAATPLVFSALNTGITLSMKDRTLYLRLLMKTHYEAVDFWGFVDDFWRIRARSASFSPEDRSNVLKLLVFLENELKDIESIRTITQQTYVHDRATKRNVERWVENLVMAALDISKVVLSAEGKNVPNSYHDTLRDIGLHYFDEQFADTFAGFADFRNILAHEYLDLRWKSIQEFIEHAAVFYPKFLTRIKEIVGAP